MSSVPRLIFSELLGLFICTESECQAAFRSDTLQHHLIRKHKVPRGISRKETERLLFIASKAKRHPLAERYLLDPLPRHGEESLSAVPDLPIFDVFKCPLCTLYFRGMRATKAHIRSRHCTSDSMKSAIDSVSSAKSVKGQSVFNGPQRMFFPVTVISPLPDAENHFSDQPTPALCAATSYLESTGRRGGAEQIASIDKTQNLSSQLLGIQDFLNMWEITTEQAYELTRVKCKRTYSHVSKLMVTYLQYFADMMPPIPTPIIEFIKIKSDTSRASFTLSLPVDTKKRYARVAARFLMVIAELDIVRSQQLRLPEGFIKLAKNVVALKPTSEYATIAQIHEFLRSLLLGEVRASKGEQVILEQIFKLVLSGFTKCEETKRTRMAGAEDASHTAAALQYFCHVTALGEFLMKPIGFGRPIGGGKESEQERKSCIQGMISTEACTPAAYIRTVLAKTKRLSAAETPQVRFAICETHDYCGKVHNVEVLMNSSEKGSLGYAVRSLQEDCLDILRKDLLQGFTVPSGIWDRILAFHDNLTNKEAGYFFGNTLEAREHMDRWVQIFTAYLSSQTHPVIEMVKTGEGVVMRPTKHAGEWLQKVDRLTEILYILFHICSGGPPRVTEMNAARVRNTSNGHRAIYIYNNHLALLTSYSKTSMQYEKPKPIARFLDRTTTEIALSLITFVKPLQSALLHSLFGASKGNDDYLFCQGGEILSDSKACDKFRNRLAEKGVPLTVRLYRHYRTGIVKAFLKEFDQFCGDSIAFRQSGHSEATANARYAAVDFNFEDFNAATIAGFLGVSNRWHELLGISSRTGARSPFNSREASAACQKEETTELTDPHDICAFHRGGEVIDPTNRQGMKSNAIRTATAGRRVRFEQVEGSNLQKHSIPDVVLKSSSSVQLEPFQNYSQDGKHCKRPHSALVGALVEELSLVYKKPRIEVDESVRNLLGKRAGEPVFRSEAQKAATYECAMHSVFKEYETSMLVILPTGGGKTVCWAAPAFQQQTKAKKHMVQSEVTLSVVPLVSLQQDMLRRCKAYKLEARPWEERFDSRASVIVCSIEKVKGTQYRDFVKALCSQKLLVRIVVDEVHLIVLWRHFREFGNIRTRLRPDGAKVPLVLMTATAPPSMTKELRECLGANDCCFKTIRAGTRRRNVSYTVFSIPSSSDEDMIKTCASLLLSEMFSISDHEKVIAFCLTVEDARRLAQVLGGMTKKGNVHLYYGSMCLEERNQSFEKWFGREKEPQAMIATSAFSCGIDCSVVRVGLHVGGSRSIVEFVQESGRLGRDGKNAKSLVVYNAGYFNRKARRMLSNSTRKAGEQAQITVQQRQFEEKFGSFVRFATSMPQCRREIIEFFIDGISHGPCEANESKCDVCLSVSTEDCADSSDRAVLSENRTAFRTTSEPSSAHPIEQTDVAQVVRSPHRTSFMSSNVQLEHVLWKCQRLYETACAVCAVSTIENDKEINHVNCMRGRCFRCMEPASPHLSRVCAVTPRGQKEMVRCFFCGIPETKDLHAPGTFNVKGKCHWETAKNIALLLWKRKTCRSEMVKKAPVLQKCGEDYVSLGKLLCGGEREEEPVWLVQVIEVLFDIVFLKKC